MSHYHWWCLLSHPEQVVAESLPLVVSSSSKFNAVVSEVQSLGSLVELEFRMRRMQICWSCRCVRRGNRFVWVETVIQLCAASWVRWCPRWVEQ